MNEAQMKMTPTITPVATMPTIEKCPITIAITFNGNQVDLTLDDDSNISTVADLIAIALKFDNVVDFSIFVQEHEELTNMAEELKEIYALTRDTRTEEQSQTVMKSLTEFYKNGTAVTYHAFQSDVLAIISAKTNGFNNATPEPNSEDVSDCIQEFLTKNHIQPTEREYGGIAYSEDNILLQWRQTYECKFPTLPVNVTKTLRDHYGLPHLDTKMYHAVSKDIVDFVPNRSKVLLQGLYLKGYFQKHIKYFFDSKGITLDSIDKEWMDEVVFEDLFERWSSDARGVPFSAKVPYFTLTPNQGNQIMENNPSQATTTVAQETPVEQSTIPPVKNVLLKNDPNGTVRVTIIKKAIASKPVRTGLYALAAVIGIGVGGFFAWKKLR